jgi:quercetin dioxygenase-like cupin family protein
MVFVQGFPPAARVALVACLCTVLAARASAQNQPSTRPQGTRPAHSLVIAGDSSRATSAGVLAQFRSLLDSTTITLDRLEVHKTSLAPGASPHPPHRHAHEELMLVERGTLEATQEGVTRIATPGALIFEASNELHGLKNVGSDTATYWVIAIYPRDLMRAANQPKQR